MRFQRVSALRVSALGQTRLPQQMLTALAIVPSLFILTACGQEASAYAGELDTEPEWFAQVRAEKAEYDQKFLECLAERGAGGWARIVPGPMSPANLSEDGPIPPSESAASRYCFDTVPWPSYWDWPLDEIAYQRMIQSRECVIRHTGMELAEPPSLERFLEMQGRWSAQGQVMRTLSFEEAHALNDACPQQVFGSWTRIN